MSQVILIEPTRATLAGDLHACEIRLGGTPRGLVVLITEDSTPELEVVEAMNHVALEGFESLAVPATTGVADVALARAAERDWEPEQVGVVGIGAGGTVALDIARANQLGAAVSLSPVPDVDAVVARPALRTPWLGLFGASAGDLSGDEVRRLEQALHDGSDVFSQVVVYPGVGADFHRRTEDGVSFTASYDGWQRTIEWLNARVASRLTPLALAWRQRHAG